MSRLFSTALACVRRASLIVAFLSAISFSIGYRAVASETAREKRDSARDAGELDRLQWAVTPWPVRMIVEGLLWPLKMWARLWD
jgi:hypothetical protein